MKKKILSTLITILALCTCMFTLTACGENEPPHTHTYSVLKYDTENHWYECSCGEKKDIENHKGGTATETNKATCSVCNQEYGESLGHVHTLHLTKVDAKPQSCTKEGNTLYYTCSCGKWFTDNTAATEITDKTSVVIEKDAHKYETLKKTTTEHWWECSCGDKDGLEEHHGGETTCTQKAVCDDCGVEYGSLEKHNYTELKKSSTQHWYECSCGAYETKENHIPGAAATETTDQKCIECDYIITLAIGHVHALHLTKVDAKPQSCTKEGNIEYYTCTCGKWFTDNTATTEITDKTSVVIEKDKHNYTELKKSSTQHWYECSCGAYEIKENHKGGTATCQVKATCSVCDTIYGDFAEHEPKTAWVITDTHHYHECAYGCTVKLNYSEHSFTSYVSNKDATYESDGTKTAQCDGGCGKKHTVTDAGSMLIKDEIRFTTLNVDGKNVYGKVSNATTEFVFYEEIFVSGNATYVVDDDKSCSSPIDSKTVDLVVGDNTFYVLEMVGNNVKLYTVTIHRREMFTVTFNTNGGTAVDSQIVEEDSFATAPTTTKTGYTFDKWDYNFNTPITSNKTITASWTANTNTAYKVEYYLENLENDNYTLTETLNLTGTTDTTASAEIKTFEHFTYNSTDSMISGNVDGDGSRVLCVYYTRDKYSIATNTNNTNAGSVSGVGTYRYDAKVTLTAITNIGYEFIGWYKNDVLLTSDFDLTFNIENSENYTTMFELKAEMLNFNFTSSTSTCSITGVKDNTVTEIIVPDYVTYISQSAFKNCKSLASITLPFVGSSLNGTSAFGYIFGASSSSYNDDYVPTSLKEVIITGGTSISSYAFCYCSSLTSIEIPESVTSIGEDAFNNCTALTEIKYNAVNCEDLSSNNKIFYKAGQSGEGIKVIIGKDVKHIPAYLFCPYYENSSYTPKITEIIFEEDSTCENIGEYAFYSCYSLTKVNYMGTIDQWVQIEFDYYANPIFYAKKLYINNELVTETKITTATKINKYAFYRCDSLTSVEIGDSVTSIGYSAFSGCNSLTSITFEENSQLTSIGVWAFSGCDSLRSIEIPDSVTSIGGGAFLDCDSLTKVNYTGTIDQWVLIDFGDSSANPISCAKNLYINNELVIEVNLTTAKKISSYAFYNCKSITKVIIGDSVTSIGEDAFAYCSLLTSIEIPSNVISIGYSAFAGCSSLESMIVPFVGANMGDASGVSYQSLFGYIFGGNSYIDSYCVSPNIGVDVYTFYIPSCLKEVTITGGNISYSAFSGCYLLESIEIPNSVTYLGLYAFYNCTSLTSITFNGTMAEWNAINKGSFWSSKIKATQVVCSDGTVNI